MGSDKSVSPNTSNKLVFIVRDIVLNDGSLEERPNGSFNSSLKASKPVLTHG
jgi:hypothetical protein